MRIGCALLTLLLVIGCDASPSDTDMLEVRGVTGLAANAQVTVRVEQPGRVTIVTNADFASSSVTGVPTRVRTKSSGTMRVRYLVTIASNDTIADAETPFVLQKGNLYSISASRLPANFPQYCFGCTSTKTVPLRGSAQPTTDSLSFYISNAKPCRGCVY